MQKSVLRLFGGNVFNYLKKYLYSQLLIRSDIPSPCCVVALVVASTISILLFVKRNVVNNFVEAQSFILLFILIYKSITIFIFLRYFFFK